MKVKEMPTCVNCGAPLKGLKCEYCGTEYNDVINTDKNNSISILLERGGISAERAIRLFGGHYESNI